MKRILFSLGMFACVMSGNILPACAQWSVVGSAGFSDGGTSFNSMAIDNINTPYVAYVDHASNDKITVKKYNAVSWTTVGTQAFSQDRVKDVHIATMLSNAPMVVYSDLSYGYKIVAQTFNGNEWVNIGTPGFTAGRADYVSFVIDGNDVPYVAFSDYAAGKKLTVMKYDGSKWITVGEAGISQGEAIAISMSVDNAGVPYVIFKDIAGGSLTYVMKLAGSSWTTVGAAGLGYNVSANQSAIAVDAKGTPYVTYATDNAGKSRLLKFDGVNWLAVGTAFSKGAVQQPSLATDKNGIVYMVYSDAGMGGELRMMQYDGYSLEALDPVNAGTNKGDYPTLAINREGVPYVSFREQVTGADAKATMLKYGEPQNIYSTEGGSNNNINVFPNPATRQLTVQGTGKISRLTVYDIMGKLVADYNPGLQSNTTILDITALPKGVYVLKAAFAGDVLVTSHFQKL